MLSVLRFPKSAALSAALAAALAVPAAGQEPRSPDVHFVPTPHEVVAEMLRVAKVRKNDVLFDLGSGDGRIVIAAAKKYGTRGTGIDLDPVRIEEGRAGAKKAGVTSKAEFRQADLFETDLRNATVVTLYLLPTLNVKLRPKLFQELKPGSRVVSHAFDMGDWKPDSTLMVGTSAVFYWVIPANAGGEWRVTGSGGREYTLKLKQKFQNLEGTAERDGTSVPLSQARVRGDTVTLVLDEAGGPVRLRGRIDGDSMTGTARSAASKWTARRIGEAPPLGTEADS